MRWFTNLKTATKLILFCTLMLALLGITSWESYSASKTMKANQEAVFDVDLKAVAYMQKLSIDRVRIARAARDAIIDPDPMRIASHLRALDETEASLRDFFGQRDAYMKEPTAHAAIERLAAGFPEYMRLTREALAAAPRPGSAGDPERMLAALASTNQIGTDVDKELDALTLKTWGHAGERAAVTRAEFDGNVRLSVAMFVVVVVVAAAFTRLINGAIATPLESAVKVLEQVAQGDLSARLDFDREDEVGDMAVALNASLESMRSTLSKVSRVSNEVSSASAELASNAQAISSGAQEQAASLEETAASLEQISSTVKQNTENAQEASQLANTARDAAERGGEVVGAAVSAMNEITQSSKKIADIITTIDEIAFQTNLLALNAAVEAARAGEQGRGFGVVAAEVRTLAQRTGVAAKEIRGLIADSSSKVELGTFQVNESGRTLQEIVKSVKRVTDMVAEIAAASREQNTGLDQVNTAVTQVDQVTQSNAAQTEELSATATSLSDKSAELRALVSAFELGEHGRDRPVSAPAPARRAQRSSNGTAAVIALSSRRPPPRPSVPRKTANGYEEF